MAPDDLLFSWSDGELWVAEDGNPLTLAAVAEGDREGLVAIGSHLFQKCWTAASITPRYGQRVSLRSRLALWPDALFQMAGRAAQICHFHETHQFCGRCGSPTEPVAHEIARRCPQCEFLAYPRISPCVIMAVWRDGEILLAQHLRHKGGLRTVLAGFVEAGEDAETAVRREVQEEVGVEITDITYVASQPWPFPHSLMMAFTARWVSGEIKADESELVDAAWYRVDDLPEIAPPGTIARRLIDQIVTEQQR